MLVGTNTLSSGGTVYPVEETILHEKYDESINANDIALVRVRDKIEFNDRVQPVPISPEEVPANTELIVSGGFA